MRLSRPTAGSSGRQRLRRLQRRRPASASLPGADDPRARVARAGHGREPRAALPREARDRRRDRARRPRRARPDRRRVRRLRARVLGGHLPPDLPHRLGRPARPPGPAPAPLHAHPAAVDRLLRPPQDRRPDLADDERHPGARPARHRRGRDALLEHADARRDGGDHARARRSARADHVRGHVPAARDGQRRLPVLRRRRLPPGAREDRKRHGLPAGDPLGRADRARVRARSGTTRRASPS